MIKLVKLGYGVHGKKPMKHFHLLKRNLSALYFFKFFSLFLLLMPVVVPFFQSFGLGMKAVYVLQSVFAVAVFFFEVPSGYVADLLGRKKTLMLAACLRAMGLSLFPFANGFLFLSVIEFILGISLALSSGTDTALLYDTLFVLRKEGFRESGKKILGRSLFYSTLGEGLASFLASFLLILSFSIRELVILSACLGWISFFITFFLVEPPRKKMSQSHRKNIRHIFKSVFKHSKALWLVILNMIFSFSGTLFAVWLFQKYWKDIEVPLFYFGFFWGLGSLIASFSSKWAHVLEMKWGVRNTYIVLGLLPVCGYFGMAFVQVGIGVLFCFLFQMCRGLGQVLLRDTFHQYIRSEMRATAESFVQMGTRTLFIMVGPLLGWCVDVQGVFRVTFWMGTLYVGIFLFLVLPLLKYLSSSQSFQSS